MRRAFVRYSSSSCPCRSMATQWSQLRHSSVKARCCYPCCCRASGKPFVRRSLIFQTAALFPTLGVQTNARVGACHRFQTATKRRPDYSLLRCSEPRPFCGEQLAFPSSQLCSCTNMAARYNGGRYVFAIAEPCALWLDAFAGRSRPGSVDVVPTAGRARAIGSGACENVPILTVRAACYAKS